jgi:hypothetical protein
MNANDEAIAAVLANYQDALARFTEQASSTVNRQHKEAGETRRARSKLIRARQCG